MAISFLNVYLLITQPWTSSWTLLPASLRVINSGLDSEEMKPSSRKGCPLFWSSPASAFRCRFNWTCYIKDVQSSQTYQKWNEVVTWLYLVSESSYYSEQIGQFHRFYCIFIRKSGLHTNAKYETVVSTCFPSLPTKTGAVYTFQVIRPFPCWHGLAGKLDIWDLGNHKCRSMLKKCLTLVGDSRQEPIPNRDLCCWKKQFSYSAEIWQSAAVGYERFMLFGDLSRRKKMPSGDELWPTILKKQPY